MAPDVTANSDVTVAFYFGFWGHCETCMTKYSDKNKHVLERDFHSHMEREQHIFIPVTPKKHTLKRAHAHTGLQSRTALHCL